MKARTAIQLLTRHCREFARDRGSAMVGLLLIPPVVCSAQEGQSSAAHRRGHIDPTYQQIAEATGGEVYLIDPASSEQDWKQLGQRMVADRSAELLSCGVPHAIRDTMSARSEFFRIKPPANVKQIEVLVTGGQGQSRLLLSQSQLPTIEHHDLASATANDVSLRAPHPSAGTWYIDAGSVGPGNGKQILVNCLH